MLVSDQPSEFRKPAVEAGTSSHFGWPSHAFYGIDFRWPGDRGDVGKQWGAGPAGALQWLEIARFRFRS